MISKIHPMVAVKCLMTCLTIDLIGRMICLVVLIYSKMRIGSKSIIGKNSEERNFVEVNDVVD